LKCDLSKVPAGGVKLKSVFSLILIVGEAQKMWVKKPVKHNYWGCSCEGMPWDDKKRNKKKGHSVPYKTRRLAAWQRATS
jgi:hypothetical protein